MTTARPSERRAGGRAGRPARRHRARPAPALGRRIAGHQRLRARGAGSGAPPLILQMERGEGTAQGATRCGWSARCSRRHGPRASRCPRSSPWAGATGPRRSGPTGWWSSAGGGDDPAQDPARRRMGRGARRARWRSAAAPWPPSTPSTPTRSTGLPAADPLGDPLPYPRRAGRGAARARARRALARAPPSRRRAPGHGAR